MGKIMISLILDTKGENILPFSIELLITEGNLM